jgi:hypothetical protein
MMELFRNNKKRILALLIFLLAVSLVWRVTHPYKQPKVDALKYSGGETEKPDKKASRKEPGASSVEESLLKLDMFLNPPAHSREQRRDLFSEQEGMDDSGVLSGETMIDKASGDNTTAAGSESRVEDELSTFRSFGYMERGGERILFLEKGKQIMLVRKGDRIEGKYLVKEITKNELTLTVIPGNESIHIDLSGL